MNAYSMQKVDEDINVIQMAEIDAMIPLEEDTVDMVIPVVPEVSESSVFRWRVYKFLFGHVVDAAAETRTQDKRRGAYVVPVPACWVLILFISVIFLLLTMEGLAFSVIIVGWNMSSLFLCTQVTAICHLT